MSLKENVVIKTGDYDDFSSGLSIHFQPNEIENITAKMLGKIYPHQTLQEDLNLSVEDKEKLKAILNQVKEEMKENALPISFFKNIRNEDERQQVLASVQNEKSLFLLNDQQLKIVAENAGFTKSHFHEFTGRFELIQTLNKMLNYDNENKEKLNMPISIIPDDYQCCQEIAQKANWLERGNAQEFMEDALQLRKIRDMENIPKQEIVFVENISDYFKLDMAKTFDNQQEQSLFNNLSQKEFEEKRNEMVRELEQKEGVNHTSNFSFKI